MSLGELGVDGSGNEYILQTASCSVPLSMKFIVDEDGVIGFDLNRGTTYTRLNQRPTFL